MVAILYNLDSLGPAKAGLSLSFALQLTERLSTVIRWLSFSENNFVSQQRIHHYMYVYIYISIYIAQHYLYVYINISRMFINIFYMIYNLFHLIGPMFINICKHMLSSRDTCTIHTSTPPLFLPLYILFSLSLSLSLSLSALTVNLSYVFIYIYTYIHIYIYSVYA